MNPGQQFEQLPGERKVIYLSAILGIVLFVAVLITRAKAQAAAPVTTPTPADPTGLSTPYDPNAAVEAAKETTLASIEHSAGLTFSIASNSLSHNLGSNASSGSSGGILSLVGLGSLGGGGSHSGGSQYEQTAQEDFTSGFGGTNLSNDEFQLLVQEGQALVNAAAGSQSANEAAGASNLNRYKAQPAPTNAPRGMHLEAGPNGSFYWVRDGSTIGADHAGLHV